MAKKKKLTYKKKRGQDVQFVLFDREKRDKRQTDKLTDGIDYKKISKVAGNKKHMVVKFVGHYKGELMARQYAFVGDATPENIQRAVKESVSTIFKTKNFDSGERKPKAFLRWKNYLEGMRFTFS